ncbi:hypothetical protein KJ940_04260, partial [Myxococcota bacterium]|nr:hypothetical protein [Myxococcota bacterium]
PSPPPRLTSEAAYARALTHASAGDADAAAEALREALSESAQPERLRARARGEPAFSRLSSPALDRVLGRKRRRPRPAPTPKLTMERL